MEPIDLQGQTALVTGGSRGIGLAVVEALARAGARVTFTARSAPAIAAAARHLGGLPAEGHVCDLTNLAGMEGLLSRGFDILINNAAVIGPIGHITDIATADFARCIETNLTAAFHALRGALGPMAARGRGTIVNISSGAAHRPQEGWSAYCAGKAGLAMLTRAAHLEYGGRGVRVFGLAPGVVDTDMQGEIRASRLNPVSQLPRASLAPPAAPARAVAWLCTAAADGLAGQELDVRDPALRRACGLPETV